MGYVFLSALKVKRSTVYFCCVTKAEFKRVNSTLLSFLHNKVQLIFDLHSWLNKLSPSFHGRHHFLTFECLFVFEITIWYM